LTINCTSDDTDVVPEIEVSADGTEISVTLGVGEKDTMDYFQEMTSYSAYWSYTSFWCGYLYTSTTVPEVAIDDSESLTDAEETPTSITDGEGLPTGTPTVKSRGETVASGFRTSFLAHVILTLMAVIVVTLTMPGREESTSSLFGFGKVFVVASVASSNLSRSDKNANAGRNKKYARQNVLIFSTRKIFNYESRKK
jgi:hypothetical protein